MVKNKINIQKKIYIDDIFLYPIIILNINKNKELNKNINISIYIVFLT